MPPTAPAGTPRPASRLDWTSLLAPALAGEGLRTEFQPIVDLRRRVIVGYEALARFAHAGGGAPPGPDRWFTEAAARGESARLEARALERALRMRANLPRNCFMTVNVEPDHIADPAVRAVLAHHGPLRGLVIELTEHRAWEWRELQRAVSALRDQGALIAIDDAGAGYSGLARILRLRPEILKLDRSIVDGVDADEAKAALVEMVGVFASRIDAWVIAEGVETLGEARRLDDMHVPLVQGYFFGRPAPRWAPIDARALSSLGRPARPGSAGLVPLITPVPPIRGGAGAAAAWLDAPDAWRVVVDAHARPIGIADAGSAAAGAMRDVLVVNVHSEPRDVAQRLALGAPDPAAPVAVTDNRGAYVGMIPLRRLLAHLGGVAASPLPRPAAARDAIRPGG